MGREVGGETPEPEQVPNPLREPDTTNG